jgi:hypothetical protein
MAAAETSKRIAEAQKLAQSEPTKAEETYKEVLATDPGSNESAIKNYESALVGLGELYRDQKRVDALAELVKQARSVLSSFAKAKTAKLGELQRCVAKALYHDLTWTSPTATRALYHHPKHHRHTDRRNQILHRMGGSRAKRLSATKSRNAPGVLVHGKAVLL